MNAKKKGKKPKEMNYAKKALPFFIILFFVLLALYIYLALGTPAVVQDTAPETDGCGIEYGQYECIAGRIAIPFFNPNKQEISSMKITIPTRNGTDIVSVVQPLPSNETGTIAVTACKDIVEGRPFGLEWCCTECFETDMSSPSQEVKIDN